MSFYIRLKQRFKISQWKNVLVYDIVKDLPLDNGDIGVELFASFENEQDALNALEKFNKYSGKNETQS